MRLLPAVLIYATALLAAAMPAFGSTTIYVDDDAAGDPGPGDPSVSDPLEDGSASHPFDAIQEGIDAAVAGDTVLVKDGTYTGTGNKGIDFDGRAITVESENGAESCTINCKGSGRGFNFHSSETAASIVNGFTITRGHNTGGGIYCDDSSPTISGCTITDNSGELGAGIYCYGSSSPTITNCTIIANSANAIGGGIACYTGSSSPTITNCTIINNAAGNKGGGIYSYLSHATFVNCIVWGNEPQQVDDSYDRVVLTFCDVEDGTGESWFGTGCIDAPPLLKSDGHLTAGSPCIDRCPTGPVDDLDRLTRPVDVVGVGNDGDDFYDIGAHEFMDTDADGLPDWWELKHFGSAVAAVAGDDEEPDGLTNIGEYEYGSDPHDPDTDDDGRSDGQEDTDGTNPCHPDNADKTYYVNGDPLIGNDAYDGLAPSWDGTHGPKRTIQAGIDATVSGWSYTVLVAQGTYAGSGNRGLRFGGKAITVTSESGADTCIIDCENESRGFRFLAGETAASVLAGFTIINASIDGNGAGIFCESSSPTIIGCTVKDCYADGEGAGIFCNGGNPTIRNCKITDNSGAWDASGISSYNGASPTIIGCEITRNTPYGIRCSNSEVSVVNCLITDSFAHGGVYCYKSTATITNSTIAGNLSNVGPGVAGVYSYQSVIEISNSIVWGNSGEQIHGGGVTVTYSCIQDSDPDDGVVYPGTGNTDDDPQFYCPHRVGGGDYHIMAASPCIDAATASGAPGEDFEGELRPSLPGGGYDMGADEYTDTDGDGLPDWWERAFFGSAMGADPSGDEEPDGVTNAAEYANRAGPFDADTDDDGRTDAQEIAEGSCPWHIDNAERVYYVNGDPLIGDDAYDGLAESHDGVHGPKQTIQAGIDAAVTGWSYAVQVADGVYTLPGYTPLQFAGKAIALESENGPNRCTIDSGGMGYAFTFHSGETAESIVDGFTITNGSSDQSGGIYCRLGSPTIRDCLIRGNFGDTGPGISCDASAPTIVDCTIADINGGRGAALSCNNGSSPTLFNCFIVGNAAPWNDGGAIWCGASAPTLVNCTIAGNETSGQGGGICCTGGSTPLIVNCILWGNAASAGNEIALLGSSVLTVRHSDVQGGAAGAYIEAGSSLDMDATCIDADPLFVRGPLHAYYLSQVTAGQAVTSPCVDAGSDTAAALGLDALTTRIDGGRDEGVVDMGYHAGPAPYITSIARSGNDVVIEWNGVAGVPYVLEWTDDGWSEAATWNEVSVGAAETWTHVGVLATMPFDTTRRYRVREDAAPVPLVEGPFGSAVTGTDGAATVSTSSSTRVPATPVRRGPNVRDGGNVRGGAGNASTE